MSTFYVQIVTPTVHLHNLTVEAASERAARRLAMRWAREAEPGVEIPGVVCIGGDFASSPTGKPRINGGFMTDRAQTPGD